MRLDPSALGGVCCPAMQQALFQRRAMRALLGVAAGAVLFVHLFRLKEVPRGLYLDEASIGYNALTLDASGRDEHGEFLPVYFKAMGEYKNPLYIYAAAVVFKVLGPSARHLRLTSALFFLTAMLLFAWLLARLYPGRLALWLYGWIALGFMPHYFNISRVSFEAISELPFLIAILLGVHVTFESDADPPKSVPAAVTGLIIGVSVYSYSTNRLFSPLILAVVCLLYFRRERWRPIAAMIAGFVLACIPFLVFSQTHPGALTKRFDAISYLPNPHLSIVTKLSLFLHNYVIYFSPGFLLLRGDGNLRHTSGLGGVVFWTVLALALAGGFVIARDPRLRRSRFIQLLVLLTVLTPVPAALTVAASGHVLRSLPLSLFLLLLSCYGLDALGRAVPERRPALLALCLGLLCLEAGAQTWDYFERYPAVSVRAFESYGFPVLLKDAFAQHPREVRYADRAKVPLSYSYVEFYRRLLHLPDTPPLVPSGPIAVPGTCHLYFRRPPEVPPGVSISYVVNNPDFAVGLICFR